MKKIFLIFSALVAFTLNSLAQNGDFMSSRFTSDAALGGMAGAGLASWSGNAAFAAESNIAAVPFADLTLVDAGLSYNLYAPSSVAGFSAVNAGAAFKFAKRFAVALSGGYNMGRPYQIVSQDGIRTGEFKPSAFKISAGIAAKVFENNSTGFSLGANFRYATDALLYDSKAAAFTADVYAMLKWKGLGITAGVASVGSYLKSEAPGVSLPASARLGLGYTADFAQKHLLNAMLDMDYYFAGTFAAALGLQYGFKDMLFVRAGYRYAGAPKYNKEGGKYCAPVPSHASVGLGVKFFGVKIDVAYLFGNPSIANTLCLGLGYRF